MSKNCIFCKVIKKELPSRIVYESGDILAFYDINPHTPIHILIVPKKHIISVNEVKENDKEMLGEMILTAKEIARKEGISKKGYRLIINSGKDGGQLIEHLHMHFLGGKKLGPKLVN